MAAYAKRIIHFVDGLVESDHPNPHPAGLNSPAPAGAAVVPPTTEVA